MLDIKGQILPSKIRQKPKNFVYVKPLSSLKILKKKNYLEKKHSFPPVKFITDWSERSWSMIFIWKPHSYR